MPDNFWNQFQTTEATKAPAPAPAKDGFWTQFEKPSNPAPSAEPVKNVQAVSNQERFLINTRSHSDISTVDWLKKRGYDAEIRDGTVAVRKKGAKDWGRVEPEGFLAGEGFMGKGRELLQDLSADALNELGSGVAMAQGALGLEGGAKAVAKKLLGRTIPGLGLASAVTGAAAGAAGFEGARTAAARQAGFIDTPDDYAARLKQEALLGAGGEVLGRGLSAVGGFLRKELRRPLQRLDIEKRSALAGAEHDAALGSLEAAQIASQPAKTTLGSARIVEKEAALSHKVANIEAREELLQRFAAAEPETMASIKAGQQAYNVNENFVLTNIDQVVKQTPKGAVINWPSSVLRPDYGIRADVLRNIPELGSVLRKWFGPNMVPLLTEELTEKGAVQAFGSLSMKSRDSMLKAFADENGVEYTGRAVAGFVSDLASLLKSGKLGNAVISPGDDAVLKQAASGLVTPKVSRKVMETFSRSIRGRFGTEAQAETRAGLEAANLAKRRADIDFSTEKLMMEPLQENRKEALRGMAKVRQEKRLFKAEGPTIAIAGPFLRRHFGGAAQKLVEPLEARVMAAAALPLDAGRAALQSIPGFSRLPPAQQAAILTYLSAQSAER